VLQIPNYTFSKIASKSKPIGIGWSDECIATYNNIYKPVESKSRLEGNTFKGLLKVRQ
jgi:hypothetical protein